MFKADYTGYNASIKRLYEMDKVRRRDIADIVRKADKWIIATAKATVKNSKKGAISKKYPSRSHPSGFLKKSIKFKVSKKFKLVYYVNPDAWYSMIYSKGHGKFLGNPFIDRAVSIRGSQAERLVKKGLDELIKRVK
jgi:hypothetical protein